jgi:hypothetical protein
VDAVRARVRRETLEGVHGDDGRLYVWLDTAQADDQAAPERELVEELRDRLRYVERQLEQEREANRENRRLLAAALERIPAIEAPPEATGAAESDEGATYGASPQEAEDSLQRRSEQQGSWWRRFFGLE